jgi:hypothetical protein
MAGRGRGRAPPTGARLLLQRSAQEAGLDAGNLRNLQDITKPKLFPDYEWHSTGHKWDADEPVEPPPAKRSASTIYLINKSRELHHRFEQSPYYVRPTIESDVVRYGIRPRPVEPDISVLEHIPEMADPAYMPPELLQKTTTQLSMKELMATNEGAPAKALTLEELAAQELKRRREAMEAEEEGNLSDIEVVEEEEEDEVADYTANYYASDDESEGGGGGGDEATF